MKKSFALRRWTLRILLILFAGWSLFEDVRNARPLAFYRESPSRLLYVLALAVAVSALVFLVGRLYGGRKSLAAAIKSCVHCGYNLTGNTSGTCPECGTTVKDA